jgi:hypothetical protein
MKKLLLILVLAFYGGFIFAQDLFFSEYIEGSGNNKGVEIYNPTDQPIDLNNYYVARYSNGSSVYTEGGLTHLEGTIQPYSTFVLINGQTTSTPSSPACDPALQALADMLDHDYPAPTYMNGNDAIALIKTPNGEPPNSTNITPVDLIGEIGLGSLISAETGWSNVQDSTLTYNGSDENPVTGKVINYIVQAKATDGVTYGPYWMSWTSDHSLIRKPEVIQGVLINPDPFIVTQQWDTLPARLDTATGYYTYKDIWDNLGTHACVADPDYQSGVDELSLNPKLNIYPNPVVTDHFTIESDVKIKSAQVFDIMGKEIYNETFSSSIRVKEVQLGQKYHGICLVKVTFENNRTAIQEIIFK